MLKKPRKTVRRARTLRRELSLPEVLLWSHLRARPGGLKFRRQHPAGPFVLDFYCAEARLCIEVDGEAHNRGDRPEFDIRRDQILAPHGIVTLRIPAKAALGDIGAVIEHVVNMARSRLPLHHASHGPPPQARLGED